MTEDEARQWLTDRVPRETYDLIARFVDMVLAEAANQNLISAATMDTIWARHVVDSAQLLDLAPASGRWIDLGTGAGFPGIIVSIFRQHEVTLAESRSRRAVFLSDSVAALSLAATVTVSAGRVETMPATAYEVISARAFAPLDRLLATAYHLSGPGTRWILPKGRGAQAELDVVRGSWQGDFRIVPSITDADAAIIVAENVRPRISVRKTGSRR